MRVDVVVKTQALVQHVSRQCRSFRSVLRALRPPQLPRLPSLVWTVQPAMKGISQPGTDQKLPSNIGFRLMMFKNEIGETTRRRRISSWDTSTYAVVRPQLPCPRRQRHGNKNPLRPQHIYTTR